eukprot:1580497-Amphidinium_carterae.1
MSSYCGLAAAGCAKTPTLISATNSCRCKALTTAQTALPDPVFTSTWPRVPQQDVDMNPLASFLI